MVKAAEVTAAGRRSEITCCSPALLHVLGVTQNAEFHRGGIHGDVAERHADHVVVIDGADADAVQVGQGHHQVLPRDGATVGMLPVVLEAAEAAFWLFSPWNDRRKQR